MIRMAPFYIGCFLLLMACKNKTQQVSPQTESITESVYASGLVKTANQYQVYSTVSGLIKEILVKEGDLVKKGDPIIRLTNTAAELTAENAGITAAYSSLAANKDKLQALKINIDQAKTRLDMDASLLARQKNLWDQQIGSKNELGQREMAYNVSLHAYETAKLNYTEMERQLNLQEKQSKKNLQISKSNSSDYTIVSQTDGKVYSLLKEKGELVNTQSPVAILGSDTSFYLELQVDEFDIARIHIGQTMILSMDSYKGQVFEAIVRKVNPLMNERSKSFTIEAVFTQQPAQLFPNLSCEANIIIQEKTKALTIPRSYLLEGDFVLMADGKKQKVTTGLKDYQKVEILSGLSSSDFILNPVK